MNRRIIPINGRGVSNYKRIEKVKNIKDMVTIGEVYKMLTGVDPFNGLPKDTTEVNVPSLFTGVQ